MADITRGVVDPKDVYFWKNSFSSTYSFYSASNRQVYDDTLQNKNAWLIYNKSQQPEVDSVGFVFGKVFGVRDYEITRLKRGFVDPSTRKETLDTMYMAEIVGKR